eukprot:comp17152_c0_seq1/m.15971 comp17152_c0_seq1/g.15971  ORF comp17152_c0_seq1/g.15971 comp17152_c0_seq1/m.15971 type:complete len:1225 (-) comp17152_c0_seq1:790-4464(-)
MGRQKRPAEEEEEHDSGSEEETTQNGGGFEQYDNMIDSEVEDSDGDEDDDEEMGEMEETGKNGTGNTGNTGNDEGAPKKKQKKDGGLYRPPTSEEVHQLKETQQLFKSNLFRMQIDELVKEVRVDYSKQKFLEGSLHHLKEIFDGLKTAREVNMKADSVKGICIPLPPLAQQPIKFQFHTPVSVNLIGSYLIRTVTRPDFNVDVAVEIPKEVFDHKDHLNYRYHAKRACYLAVLAKALTQDSMFSSVKFAYFQGDPTKPILSVQPQDPEGAHKTKFTIRILPVISPDTFKLLRLAPDRNCVRHKHVASVLGLADSQPDDDEGEGGPTPHYNNSVLEDTMMTSHLASLHAHMTSCPALVEAVILFKVWLRQRGLPKGTKFANGLQGFNGFVVSMILCHLMDTRRINRQMSCYQMFRLTLDFIAKSDWVNNPASMKKKNDDETVPSPSAFTGRFDVVFIDPSGRINLCARVTRSVYEEMRHEAQLSLSFLDDSHQDGFDVLFMRPVDYYSKCDQYIHLQSLPSVDVLEEREGLRIRGDYGAWAQERMKEWVAALLRKALTDRVKLLCVRQHPYTQEWSVNEEPPVVQPKSLSIGLIVDAGQWNRIVDKGPLPTDKEAAAEFREFWGEKSELRQFKDGSIQEAVLWDRPKTERHLVMRDMVCHVLARHAGVEEGSEGIVYVAHQTDRVMETQQTGGRVQKHTDEEAQTYVMNLYQHVCKEVRNLRDVPLRVHSIQPVSPGLRFTEVFTPKPHGYTAASGGLPPSLPVLDSLLVMEPSAKWPDDLTAIQHAKTAFYLKMASLMEEGDTKKGKAAFGGVSEFDALPTTVTAYQDRLEIIKGGLCFRFQISLEREEYLLRVDAGDVIAAKEHTVRYARRPRHATVITDIHHKYPSYSGAVRLLKRWLHCHLFTSFISDEAAEVLTAHVYLHPSPYQTPSSSLCGFLRVLSLLASHDWDSNALIVDLDRTLTAQDMTGIQNLIGESVAKGTRDSLPAMFLATPLDKVHRDRTNTGALAPGETGLATPWVSPWTRNFKLTRQLLLRVVAFAKTALKVLRQQISPGAANSDDEVDLKQIFITPTTDYDVIIRLKGSVVPTAVQNINRPIKRMKKDKFRNLQDFGQAGEPVANLEPVEKYVSLLRTYFSQYALFFYDRDGGDTVGVVWLPKATASHPFSIAQAAQSMPVSVKTPVPGKKKGAAPSPVSLVPNLASMIAQFRLLGQGLVESVNLQ